MKYPCRIWNKNVGTNSIQCDICDHWVHLRCTTLTKNDLVTLGSSDDPWYCQLCLGNCLPFSSLNQEDFEILLTLDHENNLDDSTLI